MTCVRGKEAACKNEMVRVLEDYSNEFYGDQIKKYFEELEDEDPEQEDQELPIEDAIAKEIAELKSQTSTGFKTREEKKRELFSGMEIGCECGK